jgi:Asp-tRNA(Asn)/Glu-tRNA(Gln) amidotransferase A subunit family amidase
MKTISVSSTIPIIAASIIISWLVRNISKTRQHSRNARKRVQAKRKARDEHRQELLHLLRTKYSRYLPDRSIADSIARSTATELIDGIQTKRFTYAQITLVMCLRALKAGLAINCVTEEFYDEAMERAIAMDENRAELEEELLLKGIPISLKDQINQRNADSSMGMVMRNFRPSTEDSLVFELLKEQGALGGFVRTCTVQSMMVPDGDSLTYGQTYNPFNLMRTPGGSSGKRTLYCFYSLRFFCAYIGGECALIACRGSPLGIGSDLGGSIRIPAHFCGLFGFKPTPGRVSEKGVSMQLRWNFGGETNIGGTVGPLARCTDDLVLVMRSWLKPKMWHNDPAIAGQPWREERYTESKKFTIGYYINDNYMPAAPSCIRAVEEAADTFRQLGHTLVPYKPFDVCEAVRLYVAIVGADGLRHFLDGLENEPPHPMYGPMILAATLPRPIRTIITSLISLLGENALPLY